MKSSESNKVTSNPETTCRQSLYRHKQIINAGKGGGGRVEGEREREAFDKRVDVSRSGSRKTFRESKTIRKELCHVAEIPG